MPHTVAQAGAATIVLAVLLVVSFLAVRRWGTDDATDALVVLWRKFMSPGGTKPVQRPAAIQRPTKKPARSRPPAKAKAAVKARAPVKAKAPPRPKPKSAPVPKPKPDTTTPAPAPPAAEQAPRVRSTRERDKQAMSVDGDHLSLADEQPASPEPQDSKLRFRQRFRRGLSKTREVLNRDVREVFGRGPIPESFDQLEEILVAADVGVATATALTDELRARTDLTSTTLPGALKDVMVAQLASADRRLKLVRGRLSVWVVVGVNGTGKTTTIAKLAARAKGANIKLSLAAADTFRAAAVEQLVEWGRRIGVEVVRQDQGADPGAVVFDAIAHAKAVGDALLIVDTAGRLHTRKPLMDELKKVFRIVDRDPDAVVAECLLVIDATTGQNGIAQARAFSEAVNVTGLALAKLDGTAKGGIVFAVERELGVPVKAVGIGENEKDLVPFEPKAFVDAMIGDEPDGPD